MKKITINAKIKAAREDAWAYYTNPEHIVNWNFASDDWCCPKAENDLKVGGKYLAKMEAKDGSFGFDFETTYSEVTTNESFTYGLGDRNVSVNFNNVGDQTEVIIKFDPETENPIDMQRNGRQAILNNFKKYAESK
ncbi:MAG: hypothetical protein ACI9P5_003052 [Saprospiraceae bacterium]|jgi:uncharacterized protein YndB with AHSA1/START domain